jgi:hypothetical protein
MKIRGLSDTQERDARNDVPAISPPLFLVNANYQEPDAGQNENICMALIEPKPRPPPLMPERDSVLLNLNKKRQKLAENKQQEGERFKSTETQTDDLDAIEVDPTYHTKTEIKKKNKKKYFKK